MAGPTLSIAEAARISGLDERRVREVVRAGLRGTTRAGRRYAFSFQDLVVLRAARELLEAKVPAAALRRALEALALELPPERPLSGLRIYADGRRVAVCDGDAAWQPETGQTLFAFDLDGLAESVDVARAKREADATTARARARLEFERGLDTEDTDAALAGACYRRALSLDPELVDAYVNLGRIVHEGGHAREATRLYRQALDRTPDDPIVHFNLALALEDAEGPAAAADAYRRALALDPDFADAHWNLAGLCEKLGLPAEALRHYNAYRRLR